ncbi:demethylmenaquinone methyltransferase [Streptomyces calidiresistens]|uniref:Putative 4-hydroxy-4-methyl-2-oxoglutarate aldolase n=1 Tax=Streptomyces calidiresistens TaxID=1485586 RepID=A0A7W3T3P6_9ACTN|nr:RraA family protein [Streptomyces calidiresistens]MBB0230359.1 RraA family protein [Streptomyces calidiresistens]
MGEPGIVERLGAVTTAHLADACLRVGVPVRCAPAGTRPVVPGTRVAGRALPARHAGSVDVFLEAFTGALPGDVLVVDNGGRTDEACVGDLVVLEARAAGLAGVVVWGLHRDTADIREIGLPVFSTGSLPTGPLWTDGRSPVVSSPPETVDIGDWPVGRHDLVVGDDDGVLFLPAGRAAELLAAAEAVRDAERRQADRIRAGVTLREQVGFDAYLAARRESPGHTFREHLRSVGGAIEE